MASDIPSGPTIAIPLPADAADTTAKEAYGNLRGREVNLQTTLLNTALVSIKSHNKTMERYAKQIETNADNINKSTNLLTKLDCKEYSGKDGIKLEGLDLSGNSKDVKNIKAIIELTNDIASAVGVDVHEEIKKCLEKHAEDPTKFEICKETLGKLKSLCKTISDRVSKLETQDQLRLNQAQSDHSNTLKWIINMMNSIDKIINKIIEMGERR